MKLLLAFLGFALAAAGIILTALGIFLKLVGGMCGPIPNVLLTCGILGLLMIGIGWAIFNWACGPDDNSKNL